MARPVYRLQLPPVTYHVRKYVTWQEITDDLGRVKKCRVPSSSRVPDLDDRDGLFVGTTDSPRP